ncbi:MAG: L,D-transpeptidase [Acidobacteriota bacterium]|nr:L,D-transpeptidase [Acidobacteriota bacterium]
MKTVILFLILAVILTSGTLVLFALRGDAATSPPARLLARARALLNSPQGARDDAPRPPLNLPLVEPRIIVSKSKRRLELYSDGRAVRTYRVGLGFDPVGDKVKEGDGRTPEGEFYVYVKNPKSNYYLSLGLSYPNLEHAARGLRAGLITKGQHEKISEAIKNKTGPPQNTALGGLIYIHGHGSASDWTLGCIALENEDMKELFEAVPKETKVVIEP